MVGGLVGVMLHVVFRGTSSVAQGAPALSDPARPDPLEHARPTAVPRAEPTTGAALHEAPARTESARPEHGRRDDASPTERSARPPAPAPVRPARGGMQIIDLDTPGPARAPRGMREIDLGSVSE
jgi:hypothetical protein